MPYVGNATATTFSTIPSVQRFNGDGSDTTFTLSQTVTSVQDILVSVDGVVQDSNAYTVPDGTTLTFSAAPSSGTGNIFVNYLALTDGSVTVPEANKGNFKHGGMFRTNAQSLDSDVTIAATENANVTGPLTIASGSTLTIESGGERSNTMSNLLVQNIKHTNNTSAQTIDTSGRTTAVLNNDTTYRSDAGAVTQNLVQGLCKAWCQASQDGGNIIRDSLNVATMTDTGTGIIDYNITNTFNNDDYTTTFGARRDSGGSDAFGRASDISANEIRVHYVNGTDGTLVDVDIGNIQIHGDLA